MHSAGSSPLASRRGVSDTERLIEGLLRLGWTLRASGLRSAVTDLCFVAALRAGKVDMQATDCMQMEQRGIDLRIAVNAIGAADFRAELPPGRASVMSAQVAQKLASYVADVEASVLDHGHSLTSHLEVV